MATDQISLHCLLNLQELRQKLPRSVVWIQIYNFVVQHAKKIAMVVSKTLSRNAGQKTLCSKCHKSLSLDEVADSEDLKPLRAVIEPVISIKKLRFFRRSKKFRKLSLVMFCEKEFNGRRGIHFEC